MQFIGYSTNKIIVRSGRLAIDDVGRIGIDARENFNARNARLQVSRGIGQRQDCSSDGGRRYEEE